MSANTARAIALAMALLLSAIAMAQSNTPFVPPDFKVPETLETKEFRLRMLTVNDVVKDYDAVMTSVEHLKTIWPGSDWPEGLTLEQDLIDGAAGRGWAERHGHRAGEQTAADGPHEARELRPDHRLHVSSIRRVSRLRIGSRSSSRS